jgi:hypothetical protein
MADREHEGLSLYEGLRRTGMRLDELWLDYLGLDGGAGELEVEAYVLGLLVPDAHTHNVIAQAINERSLAAGADHPVAYRSLPETGNTP